MSDNNSPIASSQQPLLPPQCSSNGNLQLSQTTLDAEVVSTESGGNPYLHWGFDRNEMLSHFEEAADRKFKSRHQLY